jgi:energy-converting hydrogenase Eha subunit G
LPCVVVRGIFLLDVLGDEAISPAIDIHLDLLLHLLDLDNLGLQRGVLLHVILVDAVQFGQDGDLEIIDVVDHLLFEVIDLLGDLDLLPLDRFLVAREVALLVAEKLMNFIREKLDIFKHIPEMVRVYGHVARGGVVPTVSKRIW